MASIDLIFCGKVLDENARLRASSLIRLLTYSHQLLCFRSIYSQCPCLSVYFRITIMPLPDWQIYRLIGIWSILPNCVQCGFHFTRMMSVNPAISSLQDVDVHGSSTLFYSIKSPARPQPTTDWPSRNDQQSMIRTGKQTQGSLQKGHSTKVTAQN